MSAIIPRNTKAKTVARSFLLALFHSRGLEITWAEVLRKFHAAELDCSDSTLNLVAMEMVADGTLERPRKGLFRLPMPPSSPELLSDPATDQDHTQSAKEQPEEADTSITAQLATLRIHLDTISRQIAQIQVCIEDRLPARISGL